MQKLLAIPRAAERPTISQILSSLVERLAEVGEGGPALAAGPPGPTPDLWADDHHIYLELDLPGGPPVEADVSIHRGRIFIRMESR